jgi:Uncharacterized protein conserved in bacteria (DUF2171)
MIKKALVQEHMEVIDCYGHHIGYIKKIDKHKGIVLTSSNPRRPDNSIVIPFECIMDMKNGRLVSSYTST